MIWISLGGRGSCNRQVGFHFGTTFATMGSMVVRLDHVREMDALGGTWTDDAAGKRLRLALVSGGRESDKFTITDSDYVLTPGAMNSQLAL